ncbi:MAG: IS701 family transposase [Phycisphaeraceae bacterium]|nr:IS701 family transposase [Phycisphaeraceae bacterium]
MDATRIGRLRGDIQRELRYFDDCFARSEGREHLRCYVAGQVSNLPRKCVEAIADEAGLPPRTLQDFLAAHRWNHEHAVDRLQQLIAEQHDDEQSIGLIDETSFPKRGDKTVAVQRQYCGASGKIDNCMVSVALGYATLRGEFRCTLDHRIFVPESWDADEDRRREAGLPEALRHQPKWKMALGMLERAQGNGVRFAWLTFDEGYGNNVQFLEALDRMGQSYVAEVSGLLHGWLIEPTLLHKDHAAARRVHGGRPRRVPRLAAQSAKANRIDRLCSYSHPMRDQPWVDYHIKDGHKGPIVWQARAARFRLNLAHEPDGRRRASRFALPSAPRWLIHAYNPLTSETKYFVSNASAGVPIERLLHVAFSRWHVERSFQNEKDQLGLDQFECRRYLAVQRHLILTAISHLLLARLRLKLIGEGQAAGEKNSHRAASAPGRGRGDRGRVAQAGITP